MFHLKRIKYILVLGAFFMNSVNSAEIFDPSTLRDRKKVVSERISTVQEAFPDANNIVVIGDVGCGKSTLINHLAGHLLYVKKDHNRRILNTSKDAEALKIRHVWEERNDMPVYWHDSSSNTLYWNCPGFFVPAVPEGLEKRVLEAYSVQELFKNSSPVKIVVAVDESIFRKLRKGLLDGIFEKIVDIFPNDDQLQSCLSLVVTHAFHGKPEINEDLEVIMKENNSSEPRVVELMCFIKNNPDRMSVFPAPTTEGVYPGDSRTSILASVGASSFVKDIETRIEVPNFRVQQLKEYIAYLY